MVMAILTLVMVELLEVFMVMEIILARGLLMKTMAGLMRKFLL